MLNLKYLLRTLWLPQDSGKSSNSSANARLDSVQANANVRNSSEKYTLGMTLTATLQPDLFPKQTNTAQGAKNYHLKYGKYSKENQIIHIGLGSK